MARTYEVLFLCTGNSARSILAEALLNDLGKGRFHAHSAGSHPSGKVNSFALELLRNGRHPVEGLHSKSWDEFGASDAPRMDFVITVCDRAAGEVCPVWPGQPVSAHWGFEDPAAFVGSDEEKRRRFFDVYQQISTRIRLFINLPVEKLDRLALEREVRALAARSKTEA